MRIPRRIAAVLASTALLVLVLATPAGAVHYLYTANDDAFGTTSGFTIGSGSSLTPIPDATEDADAFPDSAVISPDGKHLYVGSFKLQAYDIAAPARSRRSYAPKAARRSTRSARKRASRTSAAASWSWRPVTRRSRVSTRWPSGRAPMA